MKRKIITSLTVLFSVIFGMMGFSLLVPFRADSDPNDFILNTTVAKTWGVNSTYELAYIIDGPTGGEQSAEVTWELWQGGSLFQTIASHVTGTYEVDTTGMPAGNYALRLVAHFESGDKPAENEYIAITITPIVYQARVKVNEVSPSPIDGTISTPFKVGNFTFGYDIIKINDVDFNSEIHSKPGSGAVSYKYSTSTGGNSQTVDGPVFLDTNMTSSQTYIVELNLAGQFFYTSFKVEYHEIESFEISLNQSSLVYQDNIVVVFDDILYSGGSSLPAQTDSWKFVDTSKTYTMNIGGQTKSFTLGNALTNGQISFTQTLAVKTGYTVRAYNDTTPMSNQITFNIVYAPVNPDHILIGGYGTYTTVALALQTTPVNNVANDDKFFYKNEFDLSIRINDSADPNTTKNLFFSTDGGATFNPAETWFKPMRGNVTYVMKAEVGDAGEMATRYWAFVCRYNELQPSDFKLIYNGISSYSISAKSSGAQNTVLIMTYVLTPGTDDSKMPTLRYGQTSAISNGITFGAINTSDQKIIITLSAPLEAGVYIFYLEWPSSSGVGQGLFSAAFTLTVNTNDKISGKKDPMNQFLQFVLFAAGAVAVIIVGTVVYDKWLKQYVTKRFRKDTGKETDEK